ncbi:hypothetical protein [Pseudomonas eucalypticola]|uniref:Uncharacterized protein n=1 Tax=Pseudomonas eucalypticola TaxID=2599595 RepID=A0A7D5D4N4_9PSED|nr:hypothetical protein [Pseudomonas eucalypticola]QKZ02776.1 hypothetical protein HWQ56_02745 [Pseudomonas eucalypticola]
MELFRVEVSKEGKLWCAIDVERSNPLNVLGDVIGRFGVDEGFSLRVLKRVGEKRLLESTPEGIKLCFAEPIFTPYVFD